MAVYRKKLVDKDGNTIIPAIGDIYGPVYTASLQSASGGIATYTFTPDTPVEANRVYAVKFPAPTVNNAVILLGDGNITASSILLPPVAASNNPSYELAYTYNTNDTEIWLLMYTGSQQWVCLNQKKVVTGNDIDWTTVVPEAITVSDYINFTVGSGTARGYKIGPLVVISFDRTSVNVVSGEKQIGTCTSRFKMSVYGAGLAASSGDAIPATFIAISGGAFRCHTTASRLNCAGTIWLLEA